MGFHFIHEVYTSVLCEFLVYSLEIISFYCDYMIVVVVVIAILIIISIKFYFHPLHIFSLIWN